jgi:hypothetical protein
MNSTSGFQEVRSTSRSPPYRFLHEQRYPLGTGHAFLRCYRSLDKEIARQHQLFAEDIDASDF